MRMLFVLISLLIVIVSFGSCGKPDSGQSNQSEMQAIPVEVKSVRQTEWLEIVSTYGKVKTPDRVDIFSRLSGKLVRLLAREEQKVQIDDQLALVDRDEIGHVYNQVVVTATVAGRVDTIYLKEGARVSPMAPILSITRQEDLKAMVSVFETDIVKLQINQPAIITLDALPGREFSGKVSLIKTNLNSQDSKGEVEIAFDQNHPEIMPGMFVRANITISRGTTLVIPPEALRKIEGKSAVYLAQNGLAVLRFIEIGRQRTDAVEIKSGIAEGETVISFASEELKDGIHIRIIEGK